jgi:ATP-dependent DNA helicase HFM1/MER3
VGHCHSSRKGTVDTALQLLKDSTRGASSCFIRDRAQRDRLLQAAAATNNKQLQQMLQHGIGFHNAAMEPQDRVRRATFLITCSGSWS